jgi:hypothetical protein
MSWEYGKYTHHEKAKMEQEFRHLISIIPVWRQKELFAMEKESAERNMNALRVNFDEHWSEKNPAIPTPKKVNYDA